MVVVSLDAVDKRILNVLSLNCRLSYRQIAKEVGVSVATALNRVKRLEKEGVIERYSVDFNYEKVGYDVGVVIHIRVSKGKLVQVEKKIATDPHVAALYDTTGAFDVVVIAHFKSRRTLDTFLKKIQAYEFVERTQTALILNEIKGKNVQVS